MSRKRNPLADLNELARIEPDPLSTQRAIQRVQAALDEPSTARMPSFIQGAKLMSTRNLIAVAAAAVRHFLLHAMDALQSERRFRVCSSARASRKGEVTSVRCDKQNEIDLR